MTDDVNIYYIHHKVQYILLVSRFTVARKENIYMQRMGEFRQEIICIQSNELRCMTAFRSSHNFSLVLGQFYAVLTQFWSYLSPVLVPFWYS